MEKNLKKLFDYQNFEKNERLEKIIKETVNCHSDELPDDDMAAVNAAGEITGNAGTIDKNTAADGGGINNYGGLGVKSSVSVGTGGGGGGEGAGGKGTGM